MEHQRGMKAMTIPAHSYPSCRDVLVKCIKFVVPEDLDVSGNATDACATGAVFARVFWPTPSIPTTAVASLS